MAYAEASQSHPDKRFKSDQVFNLINKHFITLKDEDMKNYAVHLKRVLEAFVTGMKKTDPFFGACYQKIAYVGSYYEGLKVGMPEEFDLNVIINLPIKYENDLTIIIAPEKPGYIRIKANANVLEKLRKHVRWTEYKGRKKNGQIETHYNQTQNNGFPKKSPASSQTKRRSRKTTMEKWFDQQNMCLDQNKFRYWFESVVQKTLASFPYRNRKYEFIIDGQKYELGHKKSGPALTLIISLPDGNIIDVDLVPALEFTFAPPKPFRSHTKQQNWFAISKPLTDCNNNVLWRPSFYMREQEILKGSVKPVIRQMKKLRDTQNFKSIASYYIKVLFLHELENQKNSAEFQSRNPTFLFFHMLQKLQQACEARKILDFWNPQNNLLSTISDRELSNHSYRLLNIIKKIEKNIATDLYIISEHILTRDEFSRLKVVNLPEGIASISLEENSEENSQPSPVQNSGSIWSGIYNAFWG